MSIDISSILQSLGDKFARVEYVSGLKTGKEAEVHLVRVDGVLRALKVYKKNTKFSTRADYINLNEIGDERQRRAVKNKSRVGQRVLAQSWAAREYQTLSRLALSGAYVPQVFALENDALLMEYLGDARGCAARLSDITLPSSVASACFSDILEHIYLFIDEGFIHGDLSEFNILWFHERPYVIDFPQIVKIRNNRNAFAMLQKDLGNIRAYFARFGIPDLNSQIKEVERYFWECQNLC